MKQIPEALAAHLQGGATTLCHCWRLTRSDGTVLGFTDHDEDIVFGGTEFRAGTGFEGTELETRFGLAVTGSEVTGALSDESISEDDLASGRYDAAKIELFLVNWADVAQRLLLRTGSIGEVRREGGAFTAEIRGLAHQLDQERGRIYSGSCDADLGDARCGFDLDDPDFRGEGSVAALRGNAFFAANGLGDFESDWFSRGKLVWASGANEGLIAEVKAHLNEGGEVTLNLWQLPPHAIAEGDTFVVGAGCDKRFETCREKFANAINFRGFPHLPGNDFVLRYAVPGEPGNDGKVVR